MFILGIETSCDETAAAIVQDGSCIKSNILVSQEDVHGKFGGVVPELASRRHVSVLQAVVERSLTKADLDPVDLSAIAVTQGPGLVGALLVGISFAKGMAYRYKKPLIGVNHLEGHITAVVLTPEHLDRLRFPVIALVVSGGHTSLYYMKALGEYRLLGETLDDAAGEAFDKAAKMLGLGYPGGPLMDQMAKKGDPAAISFPRPYLDTDDFSFSGLKTALRYYLRQQGASVLSQTADIAAGFQQAIVDVLVKKALSAAHQYRALGLLVVGGVAANSVLRETLKEKCAARDLSLFIPPPDLCTDNGAMIAAAAYHRYHSHSMDTVLSLSPQARFPLKENGNA